VVKIVTADVLGIEKFFISPLLGLLNGYISFISISTFEMEMLIGPLFHTCKLGQFQEFFDKRSVIAIQPSVLLVVAWSKGKKCRHFIRKSLLLHLRSASTSQHGWGSTVVLSTDVSDRGRCGGWQHHGR
jgi:hypothetical protein